MLWSGHQRDRSRAEKGVPQQRDSGMWGQCALQTIAIGPEEQEPTLATEFETYRVALYVVGRGIGEFKSASSEPRLAQAP